MPALLVQHPIIDELIDGRARLKGGIQLDERLGPEQPRAQLLIDALSDAQVADPDEAPDVLGIVSS